MNYFLSFVRNEMICCSFVNLSQLEKNDANNAAPLSAKSRTTIFANSRNNNLFHAFNILQLH